MLASKVKAPELDGVTDWLNVSAPLSLQMLKGKIVVLDFWTFCCVDCMHILPYLDQLEKKYADSVVVIGVHSAKFNNERDSAQIQKAIERYGIKHPVANDCKFSAWESFWVREWPTLIVIDPDGYIVEHIPCSKKPHGKLDAVLDQLVEEYTSNGKLNLSPLPITFGPQSTPDSPTFAVTSVLSYPGKLCSDGELLYISDTGNHRIIVTDFTGAVKKTIGTGSAGRDDGNYESASFRNPQGLAIKDGKLYIADTENHLIRCADLRSETVTTIAGTGQQALLTGQALKSGSALATALSSPWDLTWLEDRLYICMAGPHQIWYYDPQSNEVHVHAGNAHESLLDGPLGDANLAQPSGITSDGKRLFFADAETSAIRIADAKSPGTVTTLVGKGLFEFGDIDGEADKARLQHPLAVAFHNNQLFVCDSYNHKIKLVDPVSGATTTLVGGPHAGFRDGSGPLFAEPGGITFINGKLYVADTNNHAVRVIDIENRTASTLDVKIGSTDPLSKQPFPNLVSLTAPAISLQPGTPATIELQAELPAGFHLNEEAPLIAKLQSTVIREQTQEYGRDLPVRFHLVTAPCVQNSTLEAMLQVYYCGENDQSACRVATVLWSCPISVVPSQSTTINSEKNESIKLQASISL